MAQCPTGQQARTRRTTGGRNAFPYLSLDDDENWAFQGACARFRLALALAIMIFDRSFHIVSGNTLLDPP